MAGKYAALITTNYRNAEHNASLNSGITSLDYVNKLSELICFQRLEILQVVSSR